MSAAERPYGYVVRSLSGKVLRKGLADSLNQITDYPPEQVETYGSAEEMERAAVVADDALERSLLRDEDAVEAEKSGIAYLAAEEEARRYLRDHPNAQAAPPFDHDRYPWISIRVRVCNCDPREEAEAIVAAASSAQLAKEESRILKRERVKALRAARLEG